MELQQGQVRPIQRSCGSREGMIRLAIVTGSVLLKERCVANDNVEARGPDIVHRHLALVEASLLQLEVEDCTGCDKRLCGVFTAWAFPVPLKEPQPYARQGLRSKEWIQDDQCPVQLHSRSARSVWHLAWAMSGIAAGFLCFAWKDGSLHQIF
jgi:hypothetical protein